MTGKGLEALVLSLQEKITWATAEIAKRDAIIEAQAIKIAKLEDRVRTLTAQLNTNSKNSSRPPSSDGLKKPAPKVTVQPIGLQSMVNKPKIHQFFQRILKIFC